MIFYSFRAVSKLKSSVCSNVYYQVKPNSVELYPYRYDTNTSESSPTFSVFSFLPIIIHTQYFLAYLHYHIIIHHGIQWLYKINTIKSYIFKAKIKYRTMIYTAPVHCENYKTTSCTTVNFIFIYLTQILFHDRPDYRDYYFCLCI